MVWDRKVPFIRHSDGTGARWGRRAGDMVRDGYLSKGEKGDTASVFEWRDADTVFYATFQLTEWCRGRSAAYFELERMDIGVDIGEDRPRYYLDMQYIVELFNRTNSREALGYWKFGKRGSAFSVVPVDKP